MELNEKVAYLRGMIDGMKFETDTNEGAIIKQLVDIVDAMAREIESLREEADTANDYLDELDHDLGELEEFVYDVDCDCDCCCDDDDDFDDEDDDDLYEIDCPNCHDKIYVTEDMLSESLECPNCNHKLSDADDASEEE